MGDDWSISVLWSELPRDPLEEILKKLTCACDCIQFGAVCKWWHTVLAQSRQRLTPSVPLQMLRCEDDGETREFFRLSNNKFYKVHLPEAHNKVIFGSSFGLLFTMDFTPSHEIHLLNPISRAQIQLPSANTFPNFYHQHPGFHYEFFLEKAVMSSNPVSTNNYIVVAIHGCSWWLGFYRAGDAGWISFKSDLMLFVDLVYYKGQFYAVTNRGKVVVCDVGKDPKLIEVAEPPIEDCLEKKYLVESAGELLMVTRYMEYDNPDGYSTDEDGDSTDEYDGYNLHNTVKFTIFKLDLSTRNWKEVKNLGDRMLFLGNSCSMSLSAHEHHEFKANCIYYVDDYLDGYLRCALGCHDMGVYNLEDRSIQPFYHSTRRSPLFWVTPALW